MTPAEILYEAAARGDGASVGLDDGMAVAPGQPLYFVGGATDEWGDQVPSIKVPVEHWSLGAAMVAWDVLSQRSASVDQVVGVWVDDGVVYVDLSDAIMGRGLALALAERRGELAIWDNLRGEEVRVAG